MTKASISYLSEFWLEDPVTGILTELSEVKRIQLPTGAEFDEVEATHLKSPDRWREYVNTMRADQRFEVDVNTVLGSDTDRIIRALAASGLDFAARIREFDGYGLVATHDFDIKSVRFTVADLETEELKLTTMSYRIASLVVTEYPLEITGEPPVATEGAAWNFVPTIRNGTGPFVVTAVGFDPTDYGLTLTAATGQLSAADMERPTAMLVGALLVTDSSEPPQTATLVLAVPIAEA